MISKKMNEAINGQINAEMYSSYLYLSMAAYFQDLGLPGFSNWMRIQAKEEDMHAMKFFDQVHERGGRVVLAAIDQPPADWESPLAVFAEVCSHEQKVTSLINKLVDLARGESDHASEVFLSWFVSEQVEEEASAKAVVDQLKLIKDNPQGLFMMDRELGQRVFTPPPAAE